MGGMEERPSETLEDGPRSPGVEWERDLEDRFPALEASRIGLAQDLDVHQSVPDLDVVPAGREQVQFVALLDGRRRHRIERRIGAQDPMGEGAPFPARDDLTHALDLLPTTPSGACYRRGVTPRPSAGR